MDKSLLSKYSKGIQYAIQKIEEESKNSHEELQRKIKETRKKMLQIKRNTIKKRRYHSEIERWKERLNEPAYTDFDSDAINLLSKFDTSYKTTYLKCSKHEKFYDTTYFFENPQMLINLLELGVDISPYIANIENGVMADGRVHVNTDENLVMLKFYAMYKPQSKITKNGVLYYLKNYKSIIQSKYSDIGAIVSGLEALLLLDPKKYSKEIEYHKEYLIKLQRKNGSFGKKGYSIEEETGYALIALSHILDPNNQILIRGRNYLEKQLRKKSIYKKYGRRMLVPAVEALVSLGDGPTSQLQKITAELKSTKSQLLNSKPYFVETSPNRNVQSIREKMIEMIDTAENEILISSPHLDYYSEVSSKARENPKLVVNILTRGTDDWKGDGKRFAIGALETLKKLSNVSIRIFGIIHARVLIVDNTKVLVSSADFQRMQLYDEYNAGIYTEDREVVLEARDFFMNAFNMSKSISKN